MGWIGALLMLAGALTLGMLKRHKARLERHGENPFRNPLFTLLNLLTAGLLLGGIGLIVYAGIAALFG